jgi:AraC family cel operon transcriptional repressor
MPLRCVHFKLADFVRPGEAYHFARVELTPANMARYHDHDYHEVFWAIRGRGEHLCNGRTQELRPGVIHLVRPRDRHRVRGSATAPLHLVNLAFPSRAWAAVRQRYFADEPDWFEQPLARRAWPVEGRAQATLAHWTERLAEAGRPAVALDGFLMELPRLRPALAESNRSPVPDWLEQASRALALPEHFSGGTAAFARLAGRSPSHVARAAVRWLGCTPTDLVNAARMDYSARQLMETNRPILDIALDCGLNNLSHFYALFRQRFGVSPRRYRLRAHSTVRG